MDEATGNRVLTSRPSVIVMLSDLGQRRRRITINSRLGESRSLRAMFDKEGFWRQSQKADEAESEIDNDNDTIDDNDAVSDNTFSLSTSTQRDAVLAYGEKDKNGEGKSIGEGRNARTSASVVCEHCGARDKHYSSQCPVRRGAR